MKNEEFTAQQCIEMMGKDGTKNQLNKYGLKLKLQAALMTSKQPGIFKAEDEQTETTYK